MMQAGNEGIWLYAVIGIASLLYKAWKKNQEKQGDTETSEKSSGAEVPFGLENLIQQFEEKYSQKVEPTPKKSESVKSNKYDDNKIPASSVKVEAPDTPFLAEQNKQEEVLPEKKRVFHKDVNFEAETFLDSEFDLKQMIISKTILDRPEY